MKSTLSIAAAGFAVLLTAGLGQAQAKGCLKGAVVGGVAGHYAHHHAVLGAIGGCIAGHELAKHKAALAREQAERQTTHQLNGEQLEKIKAAQTN
ncbi:hypothetical protein [Acidiphilium sp.]|uniref:hypothetical protein n=1 Tax=Acidiphilium sp. TaxID=527 RepID=UPI003CFE38AE